MAGNGYNMMNDDNCAHFCHCWGHYGSIRRQNREFGCGGTCHFGGKTSTVYACLLNSEGDDSFRKPLEVALASNKTYEGVKKQCNTQ